MGQRPKNLPLQILLMSGCTAFSAELTYYVLYHEHSQLYSFLKNRNFGVPFSKPIEKEPLGQLRQLHINNPCNKLAYNYHLKCSGDAMSKQCLDLLNEYKQCESEYEQKIRVAGNRNFEQ